MVVSSAKVRTREGLAALVREVEPRLRQALVATLGPTDGREATVDALSWAWEHWDTLTDVSNKVGYLYRVGQSAARRYRIRPLPLDITREAVARQPETTHELLGLVAKLPVQQRTVVVLVHAYGWSQADAAATLQISASTVAEHLRRALARLRLELEDHDAG